MSKHGLEQYLAKYISKAESSCKVELPENASLPQRYLQTRVIGSIEALEVLLSFHQSRMTQQVTFLPTKLSPMQRMLKRLIDLSVLQDDSEYIYLAMRFETYLVRSPQLSDVLYEEYYQCWRPDDNSHSICSKGKDDFQAFQFAIPLADARLEFECCIEECDMAINTNDQLLALLRSVACLGVSAAVGAFTTRSMILNPLETPAHHPLPGRRSARQQLGGRG